MVVDDMMNSNPKPSSPSVAWYSDPQPILFDQIDLGQGALFERDEIPAAPVLCSACWSKWRREVAAEILREQTGSDCGGDF